MAKHDRRRPTRDRDLTFNVKRGDDDAGPRVARPPPSLDGLTTLSAEAAEALGKHDHELYLRRLITLSDEAAKGIAKHKGGLNLDGLRFLSDEAAKAMGMPPEIAAGVVLIGACSSGLASNVMSYIAEANLPLSLTLTAIGTVTAPLTTPFWMWMLAGKWTAIDVFGMMMDIIKIVIVPVGAALLHDWLRHTTPGRRRAVRVRAA
jgi:hypothetical protein